MIGGSLGPLGGVVVYLDEKLPLVKAEYRHLHPVVGGHIWVRSVEIIGSEIIMVGSGTAVMTASMWSSLTEEMKDGNLG